MIVVSNRVRIPEERTDTFVERLRESHGIEDQPGFLGLKLLSPIEAETHVTMTFWESMEDYEAWREGSAYERAHADRSAERAFADENEVEIHETVVERATERTASSIPTSNDE